MKAVGQRVDSASPTAGHGNDSGGTSSNVVPTIRRHSEHAHLLERDELLEQLSSADRRAPELVKLRFFAGVTGDQTAEVLGISPRSADLLWAYARAWLFEILQRDRD